MNNIYVLLLYLPSTFGKLTQKMTKYRYTHVAISLDDSYTHFYAFSRLRAKTPPISGYIEEKRIYYTLGENIPIYTKIFEIPLSNENYNSMIAYISEIKQDPEIIYNLINMLFIPWLGGRPAYKALNCGEFVAKVIEKAGIVLQYPYYKYTPKLFDELLNKYFIFEGTLDNESKDGANDDFFAHTPKLEYLSKTVYIIKELLYRQIFKRASKKFDCTRIKFK